MTLKLLQSIWMTIHFSKEFRDVHIYSRMTVYTRWGHQLEVCWNTQKNHSYIPHKPKPYPSSKPTLKKISSKSHKKIPFLLVKSPFPYGFPMVFPLLFWNRFPCRYDGATPASFFGPGVFISDLAPGSPGSTTISGVEWDLTNLGI